MTDSKADAGSRPRARMVSFRLEDGRYTFATRDREIWIANSDIDQAASFFVRMVSAFAEKDVKFHVDAYEELGKWQKALRAVGVSSRLRRNQQAPPLDSVRWQMPGDPVPEPPPPAYVSWEDYLARTRQRDRMLRACAQAKKANRKRLMSAAPFARLKGSDVLEVVEKGRGRCHYCGSLAIERRPSKANGAPAPWAQVGRRIGSLEHLRARLIGGGNFKANLAWACLWCNTWPNERRPNATDHGGFHPEV